MKILLLNAHYWPDMSAATAQMMTGLAEELARQGHEVRVICGRRKYDEPSVLFPRREVRNGVQIARIWNSSFGKGAKWKRAVDFATWLASAELALLREPRPDVVVTLTTPPLLSVLGARYARRVGARLVPWMMDLNPDEAVAAGWLALEKSFRQSAAIIALDRFMADRIAAKGVDRRKIHVVAPWAHEREVKPDPEESTEFRVRHGLEKSFVVMYSGNHSPCHPLSSVIDAAIRLKDEDKVRFLFVGGGTGWEEIRRIKERENLTNVICLPYQPLEKVGASLGAADLHIVAMGDAFVGLVHPCKVYNLLSLGLPWIGIGPKESHLGDLLKELGDSSGCENVRHGDGAALAKLIQERIAKPVSDSARLKKVGERFRESVLAPRLAKIIVEAGKRKRD
ncbi:MAG: glycosyltransferase WbuB [Verrucomicrobia bacterium]|nr:glycosyltransferase WbuB [Verrucomicrobiota bacterium]